MTEATFRPVAAGTTALLTASVGAITINQTALWGGNTGGGTGGASATISVRRGQQDLAPEGMVFFAEVSGFDAKPPTDGSVYDPTMHDIYYTWTFGDPGEYTAPVNMLPQWRNKNVAYGPFPAHCFTKPGEYRVILTVYEPASRKSASAFVDIVVRDPNVVVPAATTVVCSSTSNWSGMPAHDVANRTTTFRGAFDRAAALKSNGALTRIVFRGGDEFHVTPDDRGPVIGSAYRNMHVSSVGGKAIIRATYVPLRVHSNGMTVDGSSISGLDIRGPWDSTTETMAEGYTGSSAPHGIRVEAGHTTIHDCAASGLWQAFFTGGDASVTAIYSEVTSTNWQDYGMYVSGEDRDDPLSPFTSYVGLLGCVLSQHKQALQGGNNKSTTDLGNRHGGIRAEGVGRLFIDCLDGFSRNSWFVGGKNSAFPRPDDQNVIRDHRNDPRTRGFFSRIMAEGGWQGYGNGPNTPSATFQFQPTNTIIDKAYFLGSARTVTHLGIGCSAFTGRNIILHRPNVGTGADTPRRAIQIGVVADYEISDANKNEPIKLYNITIINELDDVQQARNLNNDSFWEVIQVRTAVNDGKLSVDNIVVHRPNFTGGFVGDAPLSDARLGIATRYLGYAWKAHPGNSLPAYLPMDTSFGTPPNPWSLWRPQAGSPAIGSATGPLVAYDDILGNIRPAQASRGAIEPDNTPPISGVVVIGASLMNSMFGKNLSTPHATATNLLQTAGHALPVYGYATGGVTLSAAVEQYNSARAAHPNALIVMHLGGNNVTDSRPYPGGVDTMQAQLSSLLAVASGDTRFYPASLTFRDYDDTTFPNPDNGAKPYNENVIIPWIAANFPHAMASYGRPKLDFYRRVLQNYDTWLQADNIHLTASGYTAFRSWIMSRVADLLNGTSITEIPERVASTV